MAWPNQVKDLKYFGSVFCSFAGVSLLNKVSKNKIPHHEFTKKNKMAAVDDCWDHNVNLINQPNTSLFTFITTFRYEDPPEW